MNKRFQQILIAVLIGVTIISAWRYFSVLQAKQALNKELSEVKQTLASLNNENAALTNQVRTEKQIQEKLNQEKEALVADIKAKEEAISSLNLQLSQSNAKATELEANLDNLAKQNFSFQQEIADLEVEVKELKAQKEELDAKFNSVDELRKAIAGLKQKTKQAKKIPQRQNPAQDDGLGNKGFMVKEGRTTFKPKINIKVIPAS